MHPAPNRLICKPPSKAKVPRIEHKPDPGNRTGRCQMRREILTPRTEPNAAHQAIIEPDRSG